MSVSSDQTFAVLADARYISLKTYRRNGTAVPTPVWFAEHEGLLYALTLSNSGKIKRIRHTATVDVAPCRANGTTTGDYISAKAFILDNQGAQQVEHLLTRKYGWQKRLFDLMHRISGKERAYLAIHPA